MDSPELQPLPPLMRQGTMYDESNGGANVTVGEDDEEEFYSPRGSLNGNGSGSRRVFAGISAENLVGRSSSESTSSSSSYSSSSASPDRSHSISLSPPVSLSPRRSQPKSPENVVTPAPTLPLLVSDVGRSSLSSSQASSNRHVQSCSSMSSSPEKIFAGECKSPSLSPLNLSPTKNLDGSFVKVEKTQSCNEDGSSPRLSNASSGKSSSSSSSAFTLPSPEKMMTMMNLHSNHGLDQSPTISDVSDRFRHSPLSSLPLSPTLLSSPERDIMSTQPPPPPPPQPASRKHWEIPDLLTPIVESPSILNQNGVSQRKQWEIPVLSTPITPSSSVSAPPPPPPPPPPPLAMPMRQRKQWEVPSPTTPVGQPVVCRPPELKPPSRPFVLQTPSNTLVSPVELPPSIEENEEVSKPKLKPLHWDKVRASSDREMVWDHLRSSSFK